MKLPEKSAIRAFYKEALIIVHPDRLARVPNHHRLPFTSPGTLSQAQDFLLNPAAGEISRVQRRFITGADYAYHRHWFPERRRLVKSLNDYDQFTQGASQTSLTATRDGPPQQGRPAHGSNNPRAPAGSRTNPVIVVDDDDDEAGHMPPQTPRRRSQFSATTPKTPSRSTSYTVPSPATDRKLQKGTFTGNTPVFVGFSRQQLHHLDSVPDRLAWASSQNNDRRAAVVAIVSNVGSVNFRVTVYSLRNLARKEAGQDAPMIPSGYRVSDSNNAVIAFSNVVLGGPFRGMAQGQVRSEVATLSKLPIRQRFLQPWYSTPPEWRG